MTENENTMVRHEAAEALGAIGLSESIPLLQRYLHDSHQEVLLVIRGLLNFQRSQRLVPLRWTESSGCRSRKRKGKSIEFSSSSCSCSFLQFVERRK